MHGSTRDRTNPGDRADVSLWPGEDQEALERVAADAGFSASEFYRRVEAHVDRLHATADCVALGELEQLVVLGDLDPTRQVHIASCAFCTEVVSVLSGHNRVAESEFVALATMPENPTYPRTVAAGGLIGLVATALASLWGIRKILSLSVSAKPEDPILAALPDAGTPLRSAATQDNVRP